MAPHTNQLMLAMKVWFFYCIHSFNINKFDQENEEEEDVVIDDDIDANAEDRVWL